METPDPRMVRRIAEANLRQLDKVHAGCFADQNFYLLRSMNSHFLRRDEQALIDLDRALEVDRRPEIYFNRGITLLELQRLDLALDEFVIAARFNRDLLNELDAETRSLVDERLSAR